MVVEIDGETLETREAEEDTEAPVEKLIVGDAVTDTEAAPEDDALMTRDSEDEMDAPRDKLIV